MLTQSERNYLVDSMADLLADYDYEYTYDALNKIIDEWASQKEVLIEAFKKHPNYIDGKFMIAFDADFERTIEKHASTDFGNWILDDATRELKYTFPEAVKGDYHYGLNIDVYRFFAYLSRYAERCVSENTAEEFSTIFEELKFRAGQKTSRVVNKICQYLGLDKATNYNREFAKYADSLSPMVIKRHTILSINPLDYLTMSFGNSWASCHTIDKGNKRNMPNNYSGCYSSGTVSYMLDPSSMVLYTVDASYNGYEYWDQPKINRQMFHYGEDKLIQARLYPQDNDGNGEVYTPYRNIVQDIIATIFDVPNLWTLKKGTEEVRKHIITCGTNYQDYLHYSNCNVSILKGSENENRFTIGERPICIECGCRHSVAENINCCREGYICQDCGCHIDEDDVIWIDDEPYCRDCCSYCDYCEEYHRGTSTHIRRYGYVCEDCLDNFCYCEDCGEYVQDYYATWVDSEDGYICDACLDDNFATCEDCGVLYRISDMYHDDGEWLCEDCHDARNENEDEEAC